MNGLSQTYKEARWQLWQGKPFVDIVIHGARSVRAMASMNRYVKSAKNTNEVNNVRKNALQTTTQTTHGMFVSHVQRNVGVALGLLLQTAFAAMATSCTLMRIPLIIQHYSTAQKHALLSVLIKSFLMDKILIVPQTQASCLLTKLKLCHGQQSLLHLPFLS